MKLSTRTKLLFSTGDLTSSLPLAIQMFFQLYFLTDVARLEPATAGWVLGITRAWDAVNDPVSRPIFEAFGTAVHDWAAGTNTRLVSQTA